MHTVHLTIRLHNLYAMGFLLCMLLTAACSSTSTSPSGVKTVVVQKTVQVTQVISSTPRPLTYTCQLQQTPIRNGSLGAEIQGKADNAELWALLQGNLQAASMLKIVWRMTGNGTFSLVALGPQGKRIVPSWGPEEHVSSNWNKPGDEWGVGFDFPIKGCWDIHATRGNAEGDVWLTITT